MPAQQRIAKGGKCLTTSERRKQRYALYGLEHKLAKNGHKFTRSKEHRGCGPLARENRRRILELAAIADREKGLASLEFTDWTKRMLADRRRNEISNNGTRGNR
jgi:hypothetical protein